MLSGVSICIGNMYSKEGILDGIEGGLSIGVG
jgi:hypothetical protein